MPKSSYSKVIYHANGGPSSGLPATSTYRAGATVLLEYYKNLPHSGNTFAGWARSAKESSVVYLPNDEITLKNTINLYAVWKKPFKVIYHENSGTGTTNIVDSNSYYFGDYAEIKAKPASFSKSALLFSCWNSQSDGQGIAYGAGDFVKMSADVDVYAQWAGNLTVTYYENATGTTGSAPIDATEYTSGQTVTVKGVGALAKSGYDFDGWNTKADASGNWYKSGDTFSANGSVAFYAIWAQQQRTFRSQDLDTNAWYTLTANKMASAAHCLVYAESTAGVSTNDANTVAASFESIYEKLTANFGTSYDVDKNGKVIFLLLDILDGGDISSGYVAGYFHAYHMYNSSYAKYSNNADMLFIDTNPGLRQMDSLKETLAHEYQHLVSYSERVVKSTKNEQDIWINEGLSTAAEQIFYANTQNNDNAQDTSTYSRINYFNSDYTNSIAYGNNFFVWDGAEDDVLADYATAYLFFQWLRLQSSTSNAIFKEILNSTYTDYRAVTSAVYSSFTGMPAETTDAGKWAAVLRTWAAANLLHQKTGLYGYKGFIDTTVRTLKSNNGSGASLPMYPGEIVISPVTGGSVTPSNFGGTHIKYTGISTTYQFDNDGPVYLGSWLLTYNANTERKGAAENGFVASTAASPGARSVRSLSVQIPQEDGTFTEAETPQTIPVGRRPITVRFDADGKAKQER